MSLQKMKGNSISQFYLLWFLTPDFCSVWVSALAPLYDGLWPVSNQNKPSPRQAAFGYGLYHRKRKQTDARGDSQWHCKYYILLSDKMPKISEDKVLDKTLTNRI